MYIASYSTSKCKEIMQKSNVQCKTQMRMEYRVFAFAFDIDTAPQGRAQQNRAQKEAKIS